MNTQQLTFHEQIPHVHVASNLRVYPFIVKHYAKLVGKTIASVQFEPLEPGSVEAIPILVFTDDCSACVMRDTEGNGAGHLDISIP